MGGVDPRMLLGCEVTILTNNPIAGIICSIPPHLSSEEDRKNAVPVHEMLIDTGLLDAKIPIGTPIVFRKPLVSLSKGIVCSKC